MDQLIIKEPENETKLSKNFLLSDDNSTATIILVEKACEQYQRLYKKINVPFSYINFFCEEFSKYSSLFASKLKDFYDCYRTNNLVADDLIEIYTKSFYSQHKDIKVSKEEKFLLFEDYLAPTFTNEMRSVTSTSMSSLVENILNICNKIDNQDELVSQQELYERYMITKFIKNYNFKKRDKAKKQVVTEANNGPEKVTLVGNALDDEYQTHGKITKIIIPKLNLPSSYPTSTEESRINPQKVVKFICSPAKQIVFINKRKIIAVKYSSGFLDKRTKKKEKKKFDWDF